MVTPVPKHYFHLVWDEAREHLVRFEKMSRGSYTVDDIAKMVSEDKQQLWLIVNEDNKIIGAIVTQVSELPQKKVMEIVACAGDTDNRLDEFLYEGMEQLEEFARINYCDVMRVEGRKGWVRALKPYGFKQEAVVLERQI